MPTTAAHGPNQLIAYAITAVIVVGVVLLRTARPRRLRPELLWIFPVIIGLIGVSYLVFVFRPTSILDVAAAVGAAAVGVGLGWWRGKLTRIEVHPETHDVTTQVSAFGALFLVALFFGRTALKLMITPAYAVQAYAWLICFGIGALVTARLEMWLRARKLLATAKSKAA